METGINNKCKAFTSLEQSRKLAEILPLESADMIWVLANPDLPMIKAIAYEDSEKSKYYEILPAWSLASLLGVLTENKICHYDDRYYCQYISEGDEFPIYSTAEYDNPTDACYEMIIKLIKNELI